MINYIIEFLLRDKEYVKHVGYTKDTSEWKKYKVVILPSGFFESHKSGNPLLPSSPLEKLNGVPILFGSPGIKQTKNLVVIYADLIASSFYLLSRYEELVNPKRDHHGRFSALDSLASKENFLDRPVVDEYGVILREALRNAGVNIPEPQGKMTITLTHDVDVPYVYRNLLSVLGGIRRREFRQLFKNIFRPLEKNTFYTFPWLLDQDSRLENAKKIYFLRNPLFPEYYDRPYVHIHDNDMRKLIRLLKDNEVEIGLHSSYASADHLELVLREKQTIENIIGKFIKSNRNHYLRLKSFEQFKTLENAAIVHDYSVGFAEMPGFRIGTCHPVRFINPETLEVGNLILHPLIMMDGSFSKYAHMNYNQSYELACKLIDTVNEFGGELVLLWHNSEVKVGNNHRKLYKNLISYIKNEKF